MQWVTSLLARYEVEPVWIVGSDPSLDEYPDDFLDGKLSITLHLAHLKYPDATYRFANEYDRVSWFKRNRPEYMVKENIFAFPFYRRTERQMAELVDFDNPLYYFFVLRPYPPKDVEVIAGMMEEAREGLRIDFGGHGSCLHAAVYVAVMMGCNPINIIGCNHEPRGGLEHFREGNDNNLYRVASTPYAIKGEFMKEGTNLLIKAGREAGIEINWIKGYGETLHSN